MKDYVLTKSNLESFFDDLQGELEINPSLVVSTQNADAGKWGMARLWRSWMSKTGDFMASNGVTMPMMVGNTGISFRSRPFNGNDAHELFTGQWLGVDENGIRLSWSKKGRDDMRPATKGERFFALNRHEIWALDKGLTLFKPRDSEYDQLKREQGE